MSNPVARSAGLLVLSLALLAIAAPAQGPSGDPSGPPRGLRVVFVDVGQGDATIVIGPTGTALVYDGGPTGRGRNAVLPQLRRFGVRSVRYIVASHYDLDHIGGLDEVMQGLPFTEVIDRGTRDQPNNSGYRDYVRIAGSKRRTARLGQLLDLGGGARARVLAYDGEVIGRTGRLPIRGTNQQENAASLVLRVEYGDFSMWLGGDLTGGGNRTYDVETHVAPVCGDVDVYRLNHHGSVTSTSNTLVATIKPEVCIGSCGARNPFGHPHNETINKLNSRNDSRLLLNTTIGANKSGYTVGRTMTLTTDGWRYRIESQSGVALEFYTDEYSGNAPSPGDLVFSEVQRQPSASLGEYFEIVNRSGTPLNLMGLQVRGNLGTFRIASPYRLLPGGRLLFFPDGDTGRNGNLPFGHCWPFRAISLGDSFDNLRLDTTRRIDTLSYSSGFAGGLGVAAERVDVLGASTAANFKASTNRYLFDFGTPGDKNSVDTTRYTLSAGVEVLGASAPGGRAVHLYSASFSDPLKLDVMALSSGTFPGIVVGSVRIPLNADQLFTLSVGLPEFIAFVPPGGLRAIRLPVPALGSTAYLAHFLLDPFKSPVIPSTSPAVRFRFP